MSVYGAIMVGMTGLGNGIINALLTASGYDASAVVQNTGVQTMLVVCYLAIELTCYAAIVVLMGFLKVEKHVKADQQIILEHQKKAVLAAGANGSSRKNVSAWNRKKRSARQRRPAKRN